MLIYTSHLSQEKRFVFIHRYTDLQKVECEEMHRGSFGFSEYPQGKQKNTKEEQERAVKGLISRNDVQKWG